VEAMRNVQPVGPYYFGGMCDGAHIALRMAQRVDSVGEKVGMLSVFDTWVLENSQRPIAWLIHYYAQRLQELRKKTLSDKLNIGVRAFRKYAKKIFRPSVERSAWSKAYWPDKNFVPPTFSGAVTLFKRAKQPYYYVHDPEMGWGARSLGGVKIQLLPIRHVEMLHEPNVEILGQHLAECLRKTFQANAEAFPDEPRVPVPVGSENESEVL